MFHGIAPHGAPSWSQALPLRQSRTAQSHPHEFRVQGRAEVLNAAVSRTSDLQLTTDDGDSLSISFAALEQLHAESFQGTTGRAQLDYGGITRTSGVSIDIRVDGSLDTQEVADIGELLQQLSQAITDPGAAPNPVQLEDGGTLDSLSAYQFGFQEQITVDYSSSRMRLRHDES